MEAIVLATMLAFGHCETNCKVRIHACDAAIATKCFDEDIHLPPAWATFCSPAVTWGAASEWKLKNEGKVLKTAQCVSLDDERI